MKVIDSEKYYQEQVRVSNFRKNNHIKYESSGENKENSIH